MSLTYAYTIIYVADVPTTIDFYQRAFGLKQKFLTPEKDYGELLTGETTIAFASVALGESNIKKGFERISPSGKPANIEMAFTSEQIEIDFQKAIDAGAIAYEPLATKPWGQTVGYLRDNNGLLIEMCTPMHLTD